MKNRVVSIVLMLYKRLLSDLKIKYKLITVFSFFVTIPILMLGFFSYTMLKSSLEEAEKKSLHQSMSQLNHSIDYFLSSYVNTSSMLFSNLELQKELEKSPEDLFDVMDTRRKINGIISQIKNSFRFPEINDKYYAEGVTAVELYLSDSIIASYNGYYMPIENVREENWCKKLYEEDNPYYWQARVEYDGQPYIALNRRLTSFLTARDLGVMRIYVPVVQIRNIIHQNISSDQYKFFYVDDQYNSIVNIGVSEEDTELLEQIRMLRPTNSVNQIQTSSGTYITGTVVSRVAGWKLIFVTPLDIITAKSRNVAFLTLFSVIIALMLCVATSILVASLITGRIGVLLKKTDRVGIDSFVVDPVIEGEDEIGKLDRNFNRMIMRLNDYIENEYKNKIVISKTKLELLQEQINPHMLYNTLTAISQVAGKVGQNEILHVSSSLISFYKGILNKGKLIASVQEEVNMIKMYIEIIRFVYPIDLECTIDIEDSILKYYTIKLLLQPIVENAIIHGIRPNNGGMIFIGGRKIDNTIEFIVANSGVGMADDMIMYLNSISDSEESDKSYGIRNVVKRLELFFGKEYGMHFESSSTGTTVTFTIPCLTQDEIYMLLKNKYIL